MALTAIKGEKTLAELAEQFDIHPNQITHWKTQLVKQSEAVFMTQTELREVDKGPTRQELQSKIAEPTMENDF